MDDKNQTVFSEQPKNSLKTIFYHSKQFTLSITFVHHGQVTIKILNFLTKENSIKKTTNIPYFSTIMRKSITDNNSLKTNIFRMIHSFILTANVFWEKGILHTV